MDDAGKLRHKRGSTAAPVDLAEVVRLDTALLAVVHFFGSREVRDVVQRSGVPPSYSSLFTALRAVRDLPDPVSIKDVQQAIGLSHPATCRAIDRCVAEGFVDRRPSELDRRQMVLALTPAGEDAACDVEAARQDIVAKLIESWDPRERTELLNWLERLKPELSRFQSRYSGTSAED